MGYIDENCPTSARKINVRLLRPRIGSRSFPVVRYPQLDLVRGEKYYYFMVLFLNDDNVVRETIQTEHNRHLEVRVDAVSVTGAVKADFSLRVVSK